MLNRRANMIDRDRKQLFVSFTSATEVKERRMPTSAVDLEDCTWKLKRPTRCRHSVVRSIKLERRAVSGTDAKDITRSAGRCEVSGRASDTFL